MTEPPQPITLSDDPAKALEMVAMLVRATVLEAVDPAANEYDLGVVDGVELTARLIDSAARGVRKRRGEVVS